MMLLTFGKNKKNIQMSEAKGELIAGFQLFFLFLAVYRGWGYK